MRKLLIFTFIILVSFSLLSCSSNGKVDTPTEKPKNTERVDHSPEPTELPGKTSNLDYLTYSYEEMTKKYPDKTILVYLTRLSPKGYVVNEINRLLIESNTDYLVFFHELGRENYNELLMSYINSGEPVDIIYSNMSNLYYLIDKELLIPLDDLLTTGNGRKLYQSLPESLWQRSCISGSIYSVNGYSWSTNGPPSYIINKELMDKYNIKVSDLKKPLSELKPIIKLVSEGEKDNKDFKAISSYLNFRSPETMSLTNAIYLNEKADRYQAYLYIYNDFFLDWVRALYDYIQMGYARAGDQSSTYNTDDFFINVSISSSVPTEQLSHGFYYSGLNDKPAELISIVFDEFDTYTNQDNFGTGIAALSKNKEMAFDFLTRVFTDRKMSDLLIYGIEGVDYTLEDGRVPFEAVNFADTVIEYGNSFISTPLSFESLDKKEDYFDYFSKAKATNYAGFYPDTSVIKEEIEAMDALMERIREIYEKDISDIDEFIEEIRQEMKKAGSEKVLNEINRQLSEFIESKKRD